MEGRGPMRTLVTLLLAAGTCAAILGRATAASSVNSVTTDKAGRRFSPEPAMAWGSYISTGRNTLMFDPSTKGQTMLGFGSALTESAAYNFASLSEKTRSTLVDLLWAPPPAGNGYTVGRLHLGSADFSLSTYSLNDAAGDYDMSHFDDTLAHDERYVLPLARAALAAAGTTGDSAALRLFFSPWSPPAWLKINGNMIDSTHPEGLVQTAEAGAALARYFVRFTKALANHGVPVWGATLQNEPLMVMKPDGKHYEACSYTPSSQAAWLKEHLGPAVRADNATQHLKLLGYDWNKGELADWAETVLGDGGGFIDGFAFHWYQWGGGLKLADLAALEKAHPGTFTLATEACLIKHGIADSAEHDGHGTSHGQDKGPVPGNTTVAYQYQSGELFALDIMGDIHFGASGWVDWNAALDYHGGPNHINRSDIGAPILVHSSTDSFYVQSPYYYMGHFSRFVRPGSTRVACAGAEAGGFAGAPGDYDEIKDYLKPQISGQPPPAGTAVRLVAECFVSEGGETGTVVVMNANTTPREFTLSVGRLGSVSTSLPAHSIRTLTFDL